MIFSKTLIILDWDDTLFPTSWFMKNKIDLYNMTKGQENNFIQLDDLISNMLMTYKKYGKLIIVTNAMYRWIDMSIIILPKTKKILEDIEIISAKERYRDKFRDVMSWKKMVFSHIANMNRDSYNIISIGDAVYEYHALINLHNKYPYIRYLKNVKLIENPCYNIILDQIKVLIKASSEICLANRNLDLEFFRKIE